MQESATVTGLYSYPLKGFSAQALARVDLEDGESMPFDRAFAIENGPSGFDPQAPSYLPKVRFLMLMRDERVAEFQTRFDAETGELTITRNETECVSGNLLEPQGRKRIEDWISATFTEELRGKPSILSAAGHSFSDKKQKVLHLINLASVRRLEEQLECPVDPMRFRANIIVDGVPAFSELNWIGKTLRLPGIELTAVDRTERCAATNVDPKTAARNMQVPKSLMGLFGHRDFGIYLRVRRSGRMAVGDQMSIADENGRPF